MPAEGSGLAASSGTHHGKLYPYSVLPVCPTSRGSPFNLGSSHGQVTGISPSAGLSILQPRVAGKGSGVPDQVPTNTYKIHEVDCTITDVYKHGLKALNVRQQPLTWPRAARNRGTNEGLTLSPPPSHSGTRSTPASRDHHRTPDVLTALLEDSPIHHPYPAPFQLPTERQS